ncbi:MAG: Eco57I restriction-modification methylase domain-containing protein [Armatimonadota bacterium]
MPEAPDIIKELVDRYDRNRDIYRSDKYNEEQTRAEFIGPFFEALGWDVTNKAGYSPAYMDVVFEGTIRVDTSANAPDYTFRVGQTRKFFVEAKKPAVSINFNPEPANQIRRYSWSAKLPLGVLTNFHEFSVYDCRVSPKPADKVAYSRLNYLTYKDYVTRWDEIAELFSKDAVWKGAFDKYAQKDARKTGTAEVDEQFLKQIEEWRSLLAHNIALRNPSLGVRELNYAVQSTIDRIVFLRICEDRGIENECQLLAQTNGKNIHDKLLNLYYNADDKYNSGLFHFNEEKGRSEAPDRFTPGLKIDDKPLKEIIGGLYPPKSPYAFSVIGADILGNVYEQFLGKVISLSSSHKALVEEKPEVKKAGGVYYTPAYIVDYIVKNTIGKLCEGKTPKQVEKLRILDPACGSGSFLINAYAWLINWHLDWYVKDGVDKHRKEVYQATGGELRLTTKEKKRILLNNIHGVDIDSQAVEVTKLSLLLKVLEGENAETLGHSMTMFHERALPDLTNNIKCGNSLIGTDFDTAGLSDDEIRRISPFDWDKEFAHIMTKGGFDAVIGNPPYVRMEELKNIKGYLKSVYEVHAERSDLYAYFIERNHRLLRICGYSGMIVSNKFLRARYGKPLRDFLSKNACIKHVVDFAGMPVFPNATVRTIILLSTREDGASQLVLYSPPVTLEKFQEITNGTATVAQAIAGSTYDVVLSPSAWTFERQDAGCILNKLKSSNHSLASYCDGRIWMGVKSGLSDAFIISACVREEIIRHNPEAAEIIRPFVNGRDIRRYSIEQKDKYLIYAYHGVDMHGYPAVVEHLKPFRKRLEGRATRQEWYELQQPQYRFSTYMNEPKIIFPDIAKSPRFALDEIGYYGSNTIYFIPGRDLYLLGLLNSRFGNFYFAFTCAGLEGRGETYFRFFGQYLEGFPIRTINFDDPQDKAKHDKMVELVTRMLDLHKKLGAATIPGDRTQIERQIASTDREIDKLVYELYGLTEDEIKIVEGV